MRKELFVTAIREFVHAIIISQRRKRRQTAVGSEEVKSWELKVKRSQLAVTSRDRRQSGTLLLMSFSH
jgi:hypothetical protein